MADRLKKGDNDGNNAVEPPRRLRLGDFIEIEYTGKTKEEEIVFDTTDEKTAKSNNLFSERMTYGPVIICIGEHQVLKGIDDFLEGKEAGKKYKIEISAEDGFGKKDAKLLKIVPTNVFAKQRIMPEPGLQVNIDGAYGVIKTVTGGRTIVDFNHPLAGKELSYEINVRKVVTDAAEKLQSFISLAFNMKKSAVEVTIENDNAKVKLPVKLPDEIAKKLSEHLVKLTGLKGISFEHAERPAAKEAKT
jgi:FKBP-type peptidyl-prolyl cis-trans isomerase 2